MSKSKNNSSEGETKLLSEGKREQRVSISYSYVLFAAHRVAYRAALNRAGHRLLPQKLSGSGSAATGPLSMRGRAASFSWTLRAWSRGNRGNDPVGQKSLCRAP